MQGSRLVFGSAFNSVRFADISKVSKEVAKANGLKYYWTGEACPLGHVTFRYVGNGNCVSCVRRRSHINNSIKRQRKDNPDISGEVRSRIEDRLEDLKLKKDDY